jgi:hypothetical protein
MGKSHEKPMDGDFIDFGVGIGFFGGESGEILGVVFATLTWSSGEF